MSRFFFLPAGLMLALASCAPTLSSDRYSAGQVGSINRAVKGRIVSVRAVSVDRTTGIGGAAGAGLGAVAGSSLGRNTEGSIASAIVGAVVGGVAGAAAERGVATAAAYEYVVRTKNGAMMTLVQGAPTLEVGSSVIILYGSPALLIRDTADDR